MGMNLRIAQVGDALPTCSPDLMPFHIDYSGPAPISTYMHVEPAKDIVGAPCINENETENDASLQSINEENCTKMAQQEKHDASQLLSNSTTPSGAVDHVPRRFVSTFRGREIHGLDISLPDGYTGLILRSDDQTLVGTSSGPSRARHGDTTRTKSKRVTRMSKLFETKDECGEIELEMSEKVVREVGIVDLTETEDMNPESDEDEQLPTRTLVPLAQFTTFRLWSADLPADQGADEYTRSLTEWVTLAHHLHQVPP